jgi:predicted amidophosphoribosyltransferase
MTPSLIAALADLVLPQDCAGCDRPGSLLCDRCAAALMSGARRVSPTPCPAALPPCWAVSGYDGPVRAALLAYKEADRRSLVPALAGALAQAVAGALSDGPGAAGGPLPPGPLPPGPLPPGRPLPARARPPGLSSAPRARPPDPSRARPGAAAASAPHDPVLLVPIPSTPAAVRARGGDHVLRLARAAAGELRRAGWDVRVERLLGTARARRDSAGLDAAARQENLAGAFRPRLLGIARSTPARVLLVDDLVTTGATLAEAASVLRAVGARPAAAAVIAATARRDRPLRPDHGVSSDSTRGLANWG